MRMNTNTRVAFSPLRTMEGGPAIKRTTEQLLARSVLACMLWEKSFYEDGQDIADRIETLAEKVSLQYLAELAIHARHVMHLRHAPLLLLCALIKRGSGHALVADTIASVVHRADEIPELLAIYWRKGKRPLSAQLKKGLARAFLKFDEYALAKYNRDADIKLRDALFLSHAKPDTPERAALWKRLANNELATPDTWEVELSGGADKRETFERLIREGKLGYLALLRNLRNMMAANCDFKLVADAIVARKGAARVFPFRYVAAARACPQLAPTVNIALLAAVKDLPVLSGRTLVLVDVSGSMKAKLSEKSDLTRMDAAAALACLMPGQRRVFTFSNSLVEVTGWEGLPGIDGIIQSQDHGGTYLGRAVQDMNKIPHDRLIVITDEASSDDVPAPVAKNAYMINVSIEKAAVGYGDWTRITGFSENIIRWITQNELREAA
jgi:60 kDa SS-A/Ro ribonucleoprotein